MIVCCQLTTLTNHLIHEMIVGGNLLLSAMQTRKQQQKRLVERYKSAYGVEPSSEQVASAIGYGPFLILALVVLSLEIFLAITLVRRAWSEPDGERRTTMLVTAVLAPELAGSLHGWIKSPSLIQPPTVKKVKDILPDL